MVRALQVTNSTPHASGVRASVLHVRSCVGNRLFASTQLAVMPYPWHKSAVQNDIFFHVEADAGTQNRSLTSQNGVMS